MTTEAHVVGVGAPAPSMDGAMARVVLDLRRRALLAGPSALSR